MGKRSLIVWSAVVAGVCSIGSWSMSDDKAAPAAGHGDHAAKPADAAPAGGMPDAAMMEAWNKAMTPGEHHKAMEQMAGKFTYKMWFVMDPSQPKQESNGTYEAEMILGGRYLASQVKGDMMGMPFEGMSCLAFDNTIGKYVAVWIDNMGTAIVQSQGTGDGKTITLAGEMMDPMANKMCKFKQVYTIKSNDEFTLQMWTPNPANGELFESMAITYTRTK